VLERRPAMAGSASSVSRASGSRFATVLRENAQSAGYLAVALSFAAAYASREPYDDAHFFKRVAQNALDYGRLSWNVDEGPVYGSTSQTFQLLAVVVSAVTREHYMLATRVLALSFLFAAFVVIRRLTAVRDQGAAVIFAFCSTTLLFPILSGMETALAILAIAGALWLLYAEHEREPHWALGPILLLFVYLTRPDAALLVLPLLVAERWTRAGRAPWRELALWSALLAAVLLFFRWYYGTMLPLPFYAKQLATSPYDRSFIELSRQTGRQRFGLFASCAAPLFLCGLFKRDRTNLVLLGASLVFVAYHLLGTIDVMGMQGRFFVPSIPLLILAAARATGAAETAQLARSALIAAAGYLALLVLLRLVGGLPSGKAFVLDAVPPFLKVTVALGGVALLLSLATPCLRPRLGAALLLVTLIGCLLAVRVRELRPYADADYLALQEARYTVYRGLETLRACFGDKLHVYHSEVGLPGLRFQAGKVTDLAGLLSPRWLFRSKSFDQFCEAERPEAIFLPHKNYRALNQEVLASQCLRGYRRVVDESSSPLYVRRDLAKSFVECARVRRDPFVPASR
jgi:hypothetical protein